MGFLETKGKMSVLGGPEGQEKGESWTGEGGTSKNYSCLSVAVVTNHHRPPG